MFIFKITTTDAEIFYQIAASYTDCFNKISESIKNPQIVEAIASLDTQK